MSEVDATKPLEAVKSEEQPVDTVKPEDAAVKVEDTETAEKDDTESAKQEDAETVKPEDADKVKEEDKDEKKLDTKSDILKTSAKIDYNNPKNNRKFDPTVREVTDDPDQIRKQVEFYFGDWNFPQDKFMWESCGGSENKPMPIAKIHSFKRMRSFQPYSAVVAALREAKSLVVSGEEGEELIARKVPYKPMPTAKAKVEAATIYAKGFGDENPDTQFDLESFFANFGEVKGLKLRRTNEDLFKGSVFVTYADEETANKFLALDPTPKWKDHELKTMSKHAYCDEKSELIRQGKMTPSNSVSKKFYEGKDPSARGRGRGDRRDRGGGRDQDDWKKRRDHDQKNGFREGRGGGRGRGGRGRGGRGRGDRDGGRDGGRGGRDRRDRDNEEPRHSSNDVKPRIQSTADEEPSTSNGKRSRDEDGAGDEAPAAKKVDTKEEVKTES